MSYRNQLIKLIHVGKRELALEDDVYRLMLSSITGKTSCKLMNINELEQVLKAMKQKGFKHQVNPNKKPFKRRLSAKSGDVKTQIDKINAIWITMFRDGFVRDGSAVALDAYVRRMTHREQGQGVDHVGWCTPTQAYTVLESLKRWHHRLMVNALKERKQSIPADGRTGKFAPYEVILEAYTTMLARG